MFTTIVFIIGMLINTILAAYLKKDINAVKRWIRRKENKTTVIFILDDNADELELMERHVLRDLGRPYKMFLDEKELLKEIPKGINIFIIDHFLLQMSGLEIAKKIKDAHPDNFIILFSGTKSDKTLSDYIEMKIDRFIFKDNPDNYALLRKAINDGITITSNI